MQQLKKLFNFLIILGFVLVFIILGKLFLLEEALPVVPKINNQSAGSDQAVKSFDQVNRYMQEAQLNLKREELKSVHSIKTNNTLREQGKAAQNQTTKSDQISEDIPADQQIWKDSSDDAERSPQGHKVDSFEVYPEH